MTSEKTEILVTVKKITNNLVHYFGKIIQGGDKWCLCRKIGLLPFGLMSNGLDDKAPIYVQT
jgi:hypothetical protein